MTTWKAQLKDVLAQVPGLLGLARLTVETVRVCMRWRVTGLAAEAGFFALLSLPPLVFGLLGAVGYLGGWLGEDIVTQVTTSIEKYSAQFLSVESLHQVLMPTIRDALSAGRPDVISIGFLLSLWSGSRCLNVLLDTISIMYGQGGVRGIVKTRVLSLSIYCISLLFGTVIFPLIVIGPELVRQLLPDRVKFLVMFYWPLVGGLTILGLATLFYIAVPQRTSWVRDLPGAALTLIIWVVASYLLRLVVGTSIGGTSIYGPLAAAIVVLIWLYFLGIGVLIGAAMNAASHSLWPPTLTQVELRAKEWVGDQVQRLRADNGAASTTSPVSAEDDAADSASERPSGLDDRRAIG